MNWISLGKRSTLVIFCMAWSMSALAHGLHQHSNPKPTLGDPQEIDALIQRYSATGNDALLVKAAQQLRPLLAADPVAANDWRRAAWLAQAEHNFDQSLSYLKKVLETQPRDQQAWLMKASIEAVIGEHERSRKSCSRLAKIGAALTALACKASVATEPNETSRLLRGLEASTALFHDSDLSPWVYSVMADLAVKTKKWAQANEYFATSLRLKNSVQVRSAFANALLEQGKFHEVRELITTLETAPALVVARMRALQGLGENIDELVLQFDREFKSWFDSEDYAHAREMAIFYFEIKADVQTACQLAQANFRYQREPEDLELLQRCSSSSQQKDAA